MSKRIPHSFPALFTLTGRRQRSFLGSENSHRAEACGLIESALTSMETSIPLVNRLCSITGDRSISSSSSFSAENHTEAMESTNQIVCSPYWLISPTQSYSNRYSKMEEEPVSIASQSRQQGESFCLNFPHANPTQEYCSSEVAVLTCNHPSCNCLGLPYLSEDSNYTTVPEMCSSPTSVRSPKWSSSTSSLSNSSSRTYQTPTHLSVASVVSSVQLEVGPGNPMNVQPTASPSFRPLERTYETVSSYDHNTYPMTLGVDFVPDPTAQHFPGPVGMDTKSHMNMSGATLNEAPDTPKGLAQNEEGRDTEFVWNAQFTHSTACASSEGQPVYWTVDSFSDDLIQISGFGYPGVLDSNDYGEQSYRSHAHIQDALYDSGGGKRTTPSGCPNPLASEDARSNIFRWSDTSAFSALTSLGDTEPFMVRFQEQDKQNTDARTCSSGSRPQWVETPRGAHWFTDDAQQEACATGTYEKPDILEATEATYEPIDYLVERLDPQTTVTFVEAGSARFIHSVDTQSWTNTAKTDFGTCINTLGSIGP
ncbi:unnamed protein product [Dicrocoelium dendriticum]|nr:unnamed protein product [Dicrocoelium dendriticum]